jgi:hypothetical protein
MGGHTVNTISKNLNESFKPLLVIWVAITIGFTVLPGFVAKARGGDGAAFVGGMIAGSVVKGMVQRDQIRTAAAVEQANNQPRQAAQPQQTAAPQTAQQKLDQLDQLAAGGYITPEEYKTKKKAILDSM